MMMNHVYLVRHGENVANITLEFSYRKVDYSLTPKGVQQAQQTARWLATKKIDEIYASPLKRTRETAQIIAEPLGLPVTVMEAFREVNVGSLEGQKPTTELWTRHNNIVSGWLTDRPEGCFPDGEDYFTLLNRVTEGLKEVLAGKEGRNIVIVGHGGIFTFPLRDICNADAAVFSGIMPNCAVTELEARRVGDRLDARLVSFGSIGHLSGDAANLVLGIPEDSKFPR